MTWILIAGMIALVAACMCWRLTWRAYRSVSLAYLKLMDKNEELRGTLDRATEIASAYPMLKKITRLMEERATSRMI